MEKGDQRCVHPDHKILADEMWKSYVCQKNVHYDYDFSYYGGGSFEENDLEDIDSLFNVEAEVPEILIDPCHVRQEDIDYDGDDIFDFLDLHVHGLNDDTSTSLLENDISDDSNCTTTSSSTKSQFLDKAGHETMVDESVHPNKEVASKHKKRRRHCFNHSSKKKRKQKLKKV